MAKFIFVTGGVVSSLGKGIATASIGLLLKSRGIKVTLQKFDPYINVDPGTMNPFQHGEVFVTDDGAETDLDLGHYERFIDEDLSKDNNLTAGQIYQSVIEKERQGVYLGKTIQVVPHITGEIKERIRKLAASNSQKPDEVVVISEIGGTVGDIEGLPFLEAARQMRLEEGKENVLYIHLTLVPYIKAAGEYKTKPTQHSVKELREIGIQPDILLCRTQAPIPQAAKDKIALFCNVQKAAVIEAVDTENIYEIPLIFHQQNLDWLICQMLSIPSREPDLAQWQEFVQKAKNPKATIEIGVCGKYVTLPDAYKSVIEAIYAAATAQNLHASIQWIEAEAVNSETVASILSRLSGLIIPGGFGIRGMAGKTEAITYVRENKIPFLGLCVGLQCAVIEFARNVCGLKDANSTEFSPTTKFPVIDLLPGQRRRRKKGGTMRLGSYPTRLQTGTKAHQIYGKNRIFERHRHRYEVNPKYFPILEKQGLIASGLAPKDNLVEIVELIGHPFFIATQFHPEFKSRTLRPHPLFLAFIQASYEYHNHHFQIG